MPDDRLTLYLGQDLKASWQSYCLERGFKPGAAIRGSIQRELDRITPGDDAAENATHRQLVDVPDAGDKIRREIRLTPSEDEAVTDTATRESCSRQQWIVNAIRSTLTREPHFSMGDVRALWESSNQLRAIGRNLNQIARRLNERDDATFPVHELESLRTAIREHTAQVSRIVSGSTSRWRIE